MLKAAGVRCKHCGDIIYSRCIQDFHWCSRKSVAVDGGFTYLKVSGDWDGKVEDVFVKASQQELVDDWACGFDKYGTVKNGRFLSK